VKFGWQVNTWGIGDLVAFYQAVSEADARALLAEYEKRYELSPAVRSGTAAASVLEQAKIEIALKKLLERENACAFTTTFQDLHGLPQLPALAVQRLMETGFGFGAEGDWKQAMLTHAAKVMAAGLPGGTSFIEDYTYHFEPGREAALGAHMVEVCPSIAEAKPRLEVHPLAIGGKADPARLVFNAAPGPAILATIIDLGDRFRMILNEVEAVKIEHDMPALPVARVLWKAWPSLEGAAESWILSGGAHHSVYSTALNAEYFHDWAEMMQIECVHIGKDTKPLRLRDELRWSEAYWQGRRA
jgi:L-arabinose isomerase